MVGFLLRDVRSPVTRKFLRSCVDGGRSSARRPQSPISSRVSLSVRLSLQARRSASPQVRSTSEAARLFRSLRRHLSLSLSLSLSLALPVFSQEERSEKVSKDEEGGSEGRIQHPSFCSLPRLSPTHSLTRAIALPRNLCRFPRRAVGLLHGRVGVALPLD